MAGVTTANRCDGFVDYWRTPGCSGPDPFLPRMKPAGVSSSSGPGPSDKGLSHNRLIRAGCSSTPTPTRTSSPEGMTCPTTHQAPRLARPLSLTVPNAMANSSYPTWAVATVDRGRQKHNRSDKTRQPRGDGQRERRRTSAASRRRRRRSVPTGRRRRKTPRQVRGARRTDRQVGTRSGCLDSP